MAKEGKGLASAALTLLGTSLFQSAGYSNEYCRQANAKRTIRSWCKLEC